MKLEDQLKEKIENFEKSVFEELNIANNRIAKFTSELSDLSAERKKTLQKLSLKHDKLKSSLVKKCDYLKAEVWRYKHLLEEYVKAKTGPEMQERLKDLEDAVNEHSALKINILENKNQNEKTKSELEFATKIDQIETKINLLKEQIESKIDKQITEINIFFKENITIFKGTADNDNLINFEHGDYSDHSQSIRIGSRNLILNTPTSIKSIVYPVLLDFQDTKNLAIFYDEKSKSKAESISDSLIIRMLSSNLPDKINLHLYDAHMFEMFSEFLKLPGKVLKKGSSYNELIEEIEELQIAIREKLTVVWSDLNDGQQSILEYNIKKIKQENFMDIIPYHLFVIDNCQSLLSKYDSLQLFEKMNSLTRYSSNFVLMFKSGPNDSEDVSKMMDYLSADMFSVIDLTGKKNSEIYSTPDFETNNLKNEDKKQILEKFLVELSEIEKNRVNVKYLHHFENERSKWFTNKAAGSVTVPIGKSKNKDGYEYISFNTKDELSHILMVGGTGSGKTNFLTTIITSIAINYSPDEVDLYLIDMKSGAGFSIFETEKLPHAKLFIFSAENELINDVFENLKIEMDRNYEYYGKYGIDNIEDIYKNATLATNAPKRKIVIIDEFASIFTNDESYHEEILSQIENIALRGRGMGVNLFFTTQNFSNVNGSAFNKAASQFATRIVLKGDPDSCMSILDHSNGKDFMQIGKFEGFVNKNHGQVSLNGGNNFFRSFHLDNDDLRPLLKEVRELASEKGYNNIGKLIDGARAADFETNVELFNFLKKEKHEEELRKNGLPVYLGESFLIKENNHFDFKWKINGKAAGQHVLISGNETEVNLQSIYSLISSLTYSIPDAKFAIKLLNPFDDEYGINKLPELLKDYSFEIFVEEELGFVLRKMAVLLEERKQAKNKEKDPIIVIIPGLERFVKLHKGSDYEESDELKLLNNLLSDGSNYCIYFICEINKPSNFSKLGNMDHYLKYFEHRIAYFMNGEESFNMIESKLASQLISSQNQNLKNKGIYYNHSSQIRNKFKAYVSVLNSEQMIRVLKESQNNLYLLSSINEEVQDEIAENDLLANIPDDMVLYIDEDMLNSND